jgi:hypothetical protein
MSLLQSPTSSVKGELGFPVTAELADDAAQARVRGKDGTGTRCAGCHSGETTVGGAIQSKALKPIVDSMVTLGTLQGLAKRCADKNERCARLHAVFDRDGLASYAFPAAMQTLF